MSNSLKFAVGVIVAKRHGIGYLHAGIAGKVVRHLDEGDIIEVVWQDPSLDEPCVRQYRTATIHKYVKVFIPEMEKVKTVRNVLTGMTQYEWDRGNRTGQKEGFIVRGTGRTTATAMAILSESIRQPYLDICYLGRDHYYGTTIRSADLLAETIKSLVDKMGLVGFTLNRGNHTITFKPFEGVEIEG